MNLAPRLTLVPSSTLSADASHPKGDHEDSNDIDQGGLDPGNSGAGANAYVTLDVIADAAQSFACGTTQVAFVGVAHPKGLDEYSNTANLTVDRACWTARARVRPAAIRPDRPATSTTGTSPTHGPGASHAGRAPCVDDDRLTVVVTLHDRPCPAR